jgi:exonuclease III
VKIVSLNIRHGGGARVPQLSVWLKAHSADFILLTEWRANANGLRLKNELQEIGYKCEGESDGPAANGLLIGSKRPFETLDLTPQPHWEPGHRTPTDGSLTERHRCPPAGSDTCAAV